MSTNETRSAVKEALPSRFVSVVGALVVGLAGCGGGLERVPEAEVDATQKALAERLATKIYDGCRTGRFEALGDEAIPAMQEGLSPDKQKQTCAQLTGMFGDYVSMDYAETWKPKFGALYVYRFKGHFSKGGAPPEIRVVIDRSNKLSGVWLKPGTATPL
jgi:hypothetical protein